MMKDPDKGSYAKLVRETATAVGNMRKNRSILAKLGKTCLSFKRRIRRVAESGGRKGIRKKANQQAVEGIKVRPIP